jgi:hypothetical protein
MEVAVVARKRMFAVWEMMVLVVALVVMVVVALHPSASGTRVNVYQAWYVGDVYAIPCWYTCT